MAAGDDYKDWTILKVGPPDEVQLEDFGATTEDDAAHIYLGGEVVRKIKQPQSRGTDVWSDSKEKEFIQQIRELATTSIDPDADDIILDPGTNSEKSIN
jgi:hypothetical protein